MLCYRLSENHLMALSGSFLGALNGEFERPLVGLRLIGEALVLGNLRRCEDVVRKFEANKLLVKTRGQEGSFSRSIHINWKGIEVSGHRIFNKSRLIQKRK
jgi:hypothetical protein